jgi:hypothetical protein
LRKIGDREIKKLMKKREEMWYLLDTLKGFKEERKILKSNKRVARLEDKKWVVDTSSYLPV